MFGQYFYHSKTRKAVALFGRLFNDIYVLRKNSSGEVISQVKVPLAYAPRAKYLDRIREQADLYNDQKVAIKLPRMSFEIVSIQYDPARQLSKTTNFTQSSGLSTTRNKINVQVPYIVSFSLSVYAKAQDDALQVVEQVIPYFNPQYTVTIKPFSDYENVKEDIPITLTSVDFSDDFEGAVEQRRTIIYTMTFDMKLNFFGPINDQNVITTAIAKTDINSINTGDNNSVAITITPDAAILRDSDYGFNEVYEYGFE